MENRIAVDCSKRGLHLVPIGVPFRATQLSLDNNDIALLRDWYFQGMDSLEVLSLAGNPLTSTSGLSTDVFTPK